MGAKHTSVAKAVRAKSKGIPLSAAMILVTLGVVYGDVGTSPMYTLKAIMSGNGGLTTMGQDTVIGALSLIIWTMTLITTVKYVLVAMKADNHNEGGIFALYSLVKRCGRWLIVPAMIGGAALLADGILTPAVTVTTAIEGLRTIASSTASSATTRPSSSPSRSPSCAPCLPCSAPAPRPSARPSGQS